MSRSTPLINQLRSKSMQLADETHRVALVVQYVGTRFHGWQRQAQDRTVQGDIEQALKDVIGHPITLVGAGRTDAGVHGAGQVAHFDAPKLIPAHRWASI